VAVTHQPFTVIFPARPVALNADGSGVNQSTVGTANQRYTIAYSAASLQGSEIVAWPR